MSPVPASRKGSTGPPAREGLEAAWPVRDERRLDRLEVEGARLLSCAEAADLKAPVPGCPGWTLRDLVAHLGQVQRWVTRVVSQSRSVPPDRQERMSLQDPDPGDEQGLIERGRLAHAALVHALRTAVPELDCWTVWPAESGRSFWIRRQLFEALVHRVDAQNAAASSTATGAGTGASAGVADGVDLDPEVAADGVDEMVRGFIHRYAEHLRTEHPVTMELHATDTGDHWWVRLGPSAPASDRGGVVGGEPDVLVAARADELLLALWNRRPWDGLTVNGDRAAVRAWQNGAHR